MIDIKFTRENGKVPVYLARTKQLTIRFTSYYTIGNYLILRIRGKEIARIDYYTQKNIDKVWRQLMALKDTTRRLA